jgi:hypothetical protein
MRRALSYLRSMLSKRGSYDLVRLNWSSSFYKLSPRRLPLNSCSLDVDYRRTVGVVAVAGT